MGCLALGAFNGAVVLAGAAELDEVEWASSLLVGDGFNEDPRDSSSPVARSCCPGHCSLFEPSSSPCVSFTSKLKMSAHHAQEKKRWEMKIIRRFEMCYLVISGKMRRE